MGVFVFVHWATVKGGIAHGRANCEQDALKYIVEIMAINAVVELYVRQTTPFGSITLSIGDIPCTANGDLLTFLHGQPLRGTHGRQILRLMAKEIIAMVHRLVITIDMNMDAIEYLKKLPDAGVRMINRIISDVDSDKRIRLIRYQVLIVLGKINEESGGTPVVSMCNWSIGWNYSYLTSGEHQRISKVQDKAICSIIQMATRELLWTFYSRDSLGADCW